MPISLIRKREINERNTRIQNLYHEGVTPPSLSIRFGLSQTSISFILKTCKPSRRDLE